MFKILTLLAFIGAQQIFALYGPLDYCEHYTGPFDYTDFRQTNTVDGVTTVEFRLISPKTPHIQLNAEPNPTSNRYEFVFGEISEVRRRRYGQPYLVLNSAPTDVLSTYEPFHVKLVSFLEGTGRRVEAYMNGDKVLSGFDENPINPDYVAYSSYNEPSEYFINCQVPERVDDCASYASIIANLQRQIANVSEVIKQALTKAGLTLVQILEVLGEIEN